MPSGVKHTAHTQTTMTWEHCILAAENRCCSKCTQHHPGPLLCNVQCQRIEHANFQGLASSAYIQQPLKGADVGMRGYNLVAKWMISS